MPDLNRSSGGSPDHHSIPAGCRFPWQPVRGRILLQGLPEEILEGRLTMQPFLSPKDRRARERHCGLTAPAGPGGNVVLPHGTSLSSPPGARFPLGSRPAALLWIKSTQTQPELRVHCSFL